MRRRRQARQARFRWVFGRTRWLAKLIASQAGMAAITPRAARIIDLIKLGAGKRYLDIGCGTGNYAHLLAARAKCAEPPVTMDIIGGPGPVDLVGSPEHLPFADASFDCVTSLYYIRRWDDDVVHSFGFELRRILAPGGAALVMEVAPVKAAWLNALHRKVVRAGCGEVDLRGWGRMAALFTAAGFDAIDLVNVGPFLLPPVPRVGVLLRVGREEGPQ
jgi:SAM-dependent methyltransferase